MLSISIDEDLILGFVENRRFHSVEHLSEMRVRKSSHGLERRREDCSSNVDSDSRFRVVAGSILGFPKNSVVKDGAAKESFSCRSHSSFTATMFWSWLSKDEESLSEGVRGVPGGV